MNAVVFGPAITIIALAMFVVVAFAFFALPLYCIIDAESRSSEDFERADNNKTLWIVLPFVFGILAAIVYLVAVRPKLKLGAR
ncbi:MAG: hypothetical protein ACYC1I_05485 [Acidimicrobiales bacterium]